ncbi:MAG TPA: diphosphate--fructose-6-phosphate 1-phosphotransferase [Tepidisphaeraceae bacterium]|nr:diphosphate--fructose-6-phosphate 1-phosphotransferase [Tepidisphaeraceae bacterium]
MSGRRGKLLVMQGGGPTPVLNASLFGMLDEANRSAQFDSLLGAQFGMEGLVRRDWIDLSSISSADLQRIRMTPGATLGSTRYKPTPDDFQQIMDRLRRDDIRALLLIGGNGSLRGGHAIAQAAKDLGYDLSVIGIPKTIDNDIPITDRCPGYGSAARYVAQSVRDLGMDVSALPQPVSIFESMGRGVGWLAAASVLARFGDDSAPHLVYLPEKPFELSRFLASLDRIVKRLGYAIVVVSEGIQTANGKPVFENGNATQRDALNRALPGGVGSYLADVVTRELRIRCRCEKPGLCGRASMLHVSAQDLADAELVGRMGVRGIVQGLRDQAVSLLPLRDAGTNGNGCEFVPLSNMAGERKLPPAWVADEEAGVSEGFIRYAQPIVGELLPYARPLATISDSDLKRGNP